MIGVGRQGAGEEAVRGLPCRLTPLWTRLAPHSLALHLLCHHTENSGGLSQGLWASSFPSLRVQLTCVFRGSASSLAAEHACPRLHGSALLYQHVPVKTAGLLCPHWVAHFLHLCLCKGLDHASHQWMNTQGPCPGQCCRDSNQGIWTVPIPKSCFRNPLLQMNGLC